MPKKKPDDVKKPNSKEPEYVPAEWGKHPDDTEYVTHPPTTRPCQQFKEPPKTTADK